jgi:hypothetical protein
VITCPGCQKILAAPMGLLLEGNQNLTATDKLLAATFSTKVKILECVCYI